MTDAAEQTKELLKRAILQLQQMQAKLDALERAKREPIAIVGIGCRFPPTSDSLDAFWDKLSRGQDGIREIPRDRWDVDPIYDPDPATPGTMCTRFAGLIDDVSLFDPGFFGISKGEADAMD